MKTKFNVLPNKDNWKLAKNQPYDVYYSSYTNTTNGEVIVVSVFQSNVGIQFYDTFDCPQCGCQVVAQTRKGFCYSPIDSKDITKLYEEEEGDNDDDA